ncbi:MAG: alpha/beta fold hydrolase, partial [Propionibacteriaceae bacterium]|nr:alpha/beta fold hydrolase [Propionibacteriaceae bacterium]
MKPGVGEALRSRSASAGAAPTTAEVVPAAQPYYGGDAREGVLLIHGFTGSPWSMRAWAEHLESDGFRVAVPRLPGHGTSWQELSITQWQDWYACVERELAQLRKTCERVLVCGLSMGGGLALLLAERHCEDVSGLVLVNPVITSTDKRAWALPVMRFFVSSLPGIANDIAMPGMDECAYSRAPLSAAYSMTKMWREIRAHLDQVNQPLLLFRSAQDHVVDPSSGKAILAQISSHDVAERVLERSY